ARRGLHQRRDLPSLSLKGPLPARAVRAVCSCRARRVRRTAGSLVHSAHASVRGAGSPRSVATPPSRDRPVRSAGRHDCGESPVAITRASMARLIDLSHEIEHGMVTYRGLPAPAVSDWLSREASTARYAPGTTFQIGKIDLLANTGTYIDAPFHRYEDGRDVAGYALEAVADLAGVVVRASVGNKRAIDASRFKGEDVKGK